MTEPRTVSAMLRRRWNNLGFANTIAPLMIGARDMGFGVLPEDGTEYKTPRAEMHVGRENSILDYTAATIYAAPIEIRIFNSDADQLSEWLIAISGGFDNSDRAATNPAELDENIGDSMDVRYEGRELVPLDKNVYLGTVVLSATWSEAFTIPS